MTLRTWLVLSGLALLPFGLAAAPAAGQPANPPAPPVDPKTGELMARPPGDAPGQPAEPPPQRIALEGTVYLGGQAKEARLEFLTATGEKPVVATDGAGKYRLDAVGPLRKATIELRGREGQPYHEFFSEPVRSSGQRDFHLPDTGLRIKVVDAATGQGIPGAIVRLRNTYPAKDRSGQPLPPRTPGGEAPTSALSQVVKTDRDGVATSYYLTVGQAEFSAVADGYAESGETRKLAVAENRQLDAEIRLQPFGKKAALRILLPNGEPAAGAAALVLASLEPMKVLAAGAADAQGRIELPAEHAGSILAVRHAGAAFHLGKWQPPAKAGEEARLKLEPAAEPLVIQAKSGGQPLPYAEVALIAGGQRLTTHLLYQLTGASPMTDADGKWQGESLPRSAVKVLVYGRGDAKKADAVRAGSSDARAAAVPYPWPALAEVAAIE